MIRDANGVESTEHVLQTKELFCHLSENELHMSAEGRRTTIQGAAEQTETYRSVANKRDDEKKIQTRSTALEAIFFALRGTMPWRKL